MPVPSPPVISVRPRVTPTTLEFWWQPPEDDGGSPLISFTLSCASPSITETYLTDVTQALITSLTAGTNYTFTIVATNENGNSAPATYRTVRTSAKPQPVATLTASNTVSNGLLSITFTWTNPGGGDYAYYYVLGLRAAAGTKDYIYRGTRTYSTLTYTVGNLDPTQLYAFHVQRGNDAGYSTQVLVTTTRATYFDPTSIAGLQVWYDAADTAGNGSTVADGTTVATWVDKSGNSRNATAAGGSATLQTDSAGRRLNFNGTTNRYNLPSSSWIYNTPYTVFVADTPSKINNAALVANSNGSADAFAMKYTAGTTIRLAGGEGNARIVYSYDGITWLPSSTDNNYPDTDLRCNVIATNGSICIAGFGGNVPIATAAAMYSYDGIKWIPTSPLIYNMRALAWNGKIWVAGVEAGTQSGATGSSIFTSLDGIKWTDTTSTVFTTSCNAVATNGTLWVAGGVGTNNLAYSYDGVNWIASTSGNALIDSICYAVAWNGTKWVAGGFGTNTLAYSSDGITWTASASGTALLTIQCSAVAWNGTLWVAGGSGTNQLAYSSNGETWTAATSPITEVNTVSWDGTQWIAGGGEGTNRLAYSSDGITWTAATSANALLTTAYASTALTLGPTTYNASITATKAAAFVAGGTGYLAYSYDGTTWANATLASSVVGTLSTIGWNGTMWVGGGDQLTYSYDGINWTVSSSSTLFGNCNAVAWGGSKWVAGGQSTNQLAYSADGITWTASTSGNAAITQICYAVATNGTKWVAGGLGTTGTNKLAYSSNGINWTVNTSADALFDECRALATNGSIWVAGCTGTNGILYSSDGETWTGSTSGTAACPTCYAVVWNGTMWVAVGYGIAYSYDGINWTASASGTAIFTTYAFRLAWNGTKWITGGQGTLGTSTMAYSYDGINWTAFTSTEIFAMPTAIGSGNVAFSLNTAVKTKTVKTGTQSVSTNIWVAGGAGTNQLAYSYDSINWLRSTSGNTVFTLNCTAVAWNGTLWVAGANGNGSNRLAYSSDGITWTASTSGNMVFTLTCLAVAWNGTLWVAGGSGNRLAYSSDGINWTASTSGNAVFSTVCYAVAWNGTRWVAGGNATNAPYITIAYSSDGINWTASASGTALLTENCYAVAWNGTRWVAGGAGDNTVAYSSDGITWTLSESGSDLFSTACKAVAWNGTRWVAGGEGTNQLAYSSDGITWTASTSGNEVFTTTCNAVAWNGTRWVAGGDGTNQLAYSTDGITWTASTSGNAVFTSSAIAVGSGASITQKTVVAPSFVGGGSGTNQLAYSYNGIAWTASTSGNAVFTTACQAVATNGTKWVAGGYGTNRLAYSTDGITWTASTSGNTAFSTQCLAVATDNTKWVAGGFGTNRLAYSSDGITWTASSSGNSRFTTQCNAVAWSGTQWVAGGEGTNQLAYSTDGETWTASTSGNSRFTTRCSAVAWNGTQWVAGGAGTNQLAYSADGITWTASTSGNAVLTTNCKAVAWNGTLWVAGGAGTNQLAYSYDGINWTGSASGNAALSTACIALSWNGIVWTAGGSGTNQLAYSYDGITWTASTSGNATFTTQCSALATSYVPEVSVNILSTTTAASRNLAWNGGGVNTDANAIQLRDATLSIGAVQGSTAFYQGGMREMLVYTGTLSDANKAQITDYLYNKWNPPALTLVPATPIKHGLVQWLDANDASTLFQDLSGTIPASSTQIVRLWKDKSGNGYDMYNNSSSTAATVTVTTINYTLPGYSKPVPASKDITLFVVLKNNNNSNQLGQPTYYSLWQHNNLGLNGYGQTGKIWFSQEYDQFSTEMFQGAAPNTFNIYTVTMSKAQLITLQRDSINGITTVRDTVEVDSYYTGLGGPVVLCAAVAYSGSIDVGEFLYYDRVLSSTEISSTISYLQNKWGVAATLAGPNLTDNLQLWLDAADPYTVFETNGVMTIWKDRSANGYNATPSGSPTYSEGGVVFNGTSQYFDLPNGALPSGNSPYSYYAVIKPTDISGVGIIGGGADTTTFGRMAIEYTKEFVNTFMVAGTAGSGTNQLAYSTDGITWTSSTSGNAVFTTQCYAVAWNGTRWVAGGSGGNRLAYSSDGTIWTASESGSALFTAICLAVAWNGTRWVAGGFGSGGNQLAYSSDGVNWTGSTSGNAIFTSACNAVAWNGTKWVAGGQGGNQLAYSSDGITWTASTSGNAVFTTSCRAVAWNGTRWVAGGEGTNQLAYSSDGETWTASTSGNEIFTTFCCAVAWNGTRWVAGGQGTNQLAYSSDGITWTASTSGNALLTNTCRTVAWNGTRWVAGGEITVPGDNTIAYSSDGITWTASESGRLVGGVGYSSLASTRVLPSTAVSSFGVTALETTLGPASLPAAGFVAGGGGTNKLAYSSDGINWSASTSGNAVFTGTENTCYVVAWNGTLWLAGAYHPTNRIAYSSDGITWTASTSGNEVFTSGCLGLAWNGTIWVAGGTGTNRLAYSSDGITWTGSASGNGVLTSTCNAVAWNGTKWVAGGNGTNSLAYSSDGINWTASTSGSALFTSCIAVAWNGTRWVAGGSETNRLAYSSDGETWTASTSGNALMTVHCLGVGWNGTQWVATGGGTNALIYSSDGITWTASASANAVFTSGCYAPAWNGTRWVGVAPETIGYSSDGITWTASSSGSALFTPARAVASTRVLPSTSTTTPTAVPRYTAAEGGSILVNSLSATTPFLVESTYSPTLTRHFVNGEQFAQNTATPSHAQLTTNNTLGKTPWGKYMKGRIYEILVYNVQHTQDERLFVEAYLLNKWRAFGFTPTSTATQPCLWLDSSSTDKLAFSGTEITGWNDSSASGVNYASMFPSANPEYSYDPATKKYGVLFGSKGVTSGLGNTTTSPFASTISQVSIFVVARFNNTFTTNTMYSTQTGTSPMRFTAKNGIPSTGATITAPPENGATSPFAFSSSLITSPFVFSSVSTTASDTNTIWMNGTQAYTVSEAISITSGTLIYLGYGVNSPILSLSQGYNGYIFEYLIYPYAVSLAERQKLEGYLAWKWGIQGSLPVGTHPYYLSAP